MGATPNSFHLDLDGAWAEVTLPRVDMREWGPRLRFTAPSALIEEFWREVSGGLGDFTLFGSGDFHHLSAVYLRRFGSPLTLISFDNHPDWDRRPPRWACGGWINRALEMEYVRKAAIWGCGNFELVWPNRLFGNRAALREGRLEIYAWEERYGPGGPDPWQPIRRSNWKERFEGFAAGLRGADVYVTVDMDCLAQGEAVTQWEQGLFTAADVAWALKTLRSSARVAGGDLCGAWSEPGFARWTQKFASGFDHPKIPAITTAGAREVNLRAFRTIWPALTGA
jgi:hypothetical protein